MPQPAVRNIYPSSLSLTVTDYTKIFVMRMLSDDEKSSCLINTYTVSSHNRIKMSRSHVNDASHTLYPRQKKSEMMNTFTIFFPTFFVYFYIIKHFYDIGHRLSVNKIQLNGLHCVDDSLEKR